MMQHAPLKERLQSLDKVYIDLLSASSYFVRKLDSEIENVKESATPIKILQRCHVTISGGAPLFQYCFERVSYIANLIGCKRMYSFQLSIWTWAVNNAKVVWKVTDAEGDANDSHLAVVEWRNYINSFDESLLLKRWSAAY